MAFFDDIFDSLWTPKGIGSLIGLGTSLMGMFGKPQPTVQTSTTDSAERRALLARAQSQLPSPLTEEEIAKERTQASMKGRDFAAQRGIQAPGAPYLGMANTISDEAAFNAGIAATRFNKELGQRNAAALAGMQGLAPVTTTTNIQKPRTFEALAGAGQALGSLLGGYGEQKKKPGMTAYGTVPDYSYLPNTWE